jgi:hypothetical protein
VQPSSDAAGIPLTGEARAVPQARILTPKRGRWDRSAARTRAGKFQNKRHAGRAYASTAWSPFRVAGPRRAASLARLRFELSHHPLSDGLVLKHIRKGKGACVGLRAHPLIDQSPGSRAGVSLGFGRGKFT